MKKGINYTECGSLNTMKMTEQRGWVRCNYHHKIYLKNIVITKVQTKEPSELYELYAVTTGKLCECGFHCLPLAMYKREILHETAN
jgi:hypothetical protein